MPDSLVQIRPKVEPKLERPKLHKVILLNDDYTPREFVILVLQAEFRMGKEKAFSVMLTAHRLGSCVIAVYPQDVAETKATRATELAKERGYPLQFVTEPEE
jgi:ATP-dependent Clp protease adaptor protein ClpS